MKKHYFYTLGIMGLVGLIVGCSTSANQSGETTEESSISIKSTNKGGLNDFDSTGRLNLSSYQKAQLTNEDGEAAHYGEVIRIDVMDQQAKGAIAFREGYIDKSQDPRTVFWIVAHGEANDSTKENPEWHNHTSFEIPDENGQLQTVMEMPYGQYNQPNSFGVLQEDMYVRTTQKLITSNKGLYVEGDTGSDRTVKFSSGRYTTEEDRRFSVGIDSREEEGEDSGSDFRINSYTDDGVYKSSPVVVKRDSGNVGINTSNPTNPLHIDGDSIRLSEKRTIRSTSEAGEPGEFCWDDNYWYVCIAKDTWKRFELESW